MTKSSKLAEKFHTIATDGPIMAIEASDKDFAHISLALKDVGVTNPVWRCASRGAAAAALSAEGCAATRKAVFVLLDLDMPDTDGRELLQLFRQQERKLPLIVLSTSSNPDDVLFCYRAGANSYLIKPPEYDQWKEMMATVASYWLGLAVLPGWRNDTRYSLSGISLHTARR